MEILELGNLRIEIERRKVKNLRLTIYPDGRVQIAAPVDTPTAYIRSFVQSKQDWIQKRLEKFLRQSGIPSNALALPIQMIWGIPHQFKVVERPGRHRVSLAQGVMTLFAPPDSSTAKRQEFLGAWYRRILKDAAPPLVAAWAERIGVTVTNIFYRDMKSIWGSCNSKKGTIRLNTKLANHAPQCLEYVIVHELIHFFEPSHNAQYYRLLNKFFPSWREIRQGLNKGEL